MKAAKPAKDNATSRWLSFRPEIKVVDCTIRDGGLMNNHHFEDKTVKLVYDTCLAAGVDYMEIGYKSSRKGIKAGEHGDWKYCTEDTIRRIVGDNKTALKLCVMADAERCDYQGGHFAEERFRPGHDPRGDLHPPDSDRAGHGQRRARQGLRNYA